MKELIVGFFTNKIFIIAAIAWFVAQLAKMIIHLIINKELKWERLVGAGGMPSSHASTVVAFALATLAEYGTNSFQFAIALLLAIIVIHDARGVRYETSKQAVVLNKILNDLFTDPNPDMVIPRLKELVGHTPFQVFIGGLVGFIVGLICVLIMY